MLAAAAEAAGAAYAREDLMRWGADVMRAAEPGSMSGTAALARARLDPDAWAAFDVGYRSVAESV
jgi:hypothetical protein